MASMQTDERGSVAEELDSAPTKKKALEKAGMSMY